MCSAAGSRSARMSPVARQPASSRSICCTMALVITICCCSIVQLQGCRMRPPDCLLSFTLSTRWFVLACVNLTRCGCTSGIAVYIIQKADVQISQYAQIMWVVTTQASHPSSADAAPLTPQPFACCQRRLSFCCWSLAGRPGRWWRHRHCCASLRWSWLPGGCCRVPAVGQGRQPSAGPCWGAPGRCRRPGSAAAVRTARARAPGRHQM